MEGGHEDEACLLKIDFSKQVGLSRIEDGRIITAFYDRDDATCPDSLKVR